MNPIRIALVEDEPLTRISLKKALISQKEVEWVGEAETGQQGLSLLQKTLPDVALVDLGLPDIDGIELIKQLKSDDLFPTRLIILTLRDDETSVLAAFTAGADSYCMKDSSIDLLWEAVKATHEGNQWIDPAIASIILSKAKINPKTAEDAHSQSSSNNSNAHPLTDREMQVLQLIVNGYSNADIAEELFITVGTVKTHVRNILNKLSAGDRTQAAVHALRTGMVG
ncbi:MAG: response regulator [Microcystaceae cyanobacterium]